jgi:hypothetical protein
MSLPALRRPFDFPTRSALTLAVEYRPFGRGAPGESTAA